MTVTRTRIPTTHVGSLPRPPALQERLAGASTGELDAADAALVREAGRDVVARQVETGLDVVNNGELARSGFHVHVTDRHAGFGGPAPSAFWADVAAYPSLAETEFAYPDADPETGAPRRPAVTGPISYVGREAAERERDAFLDHLDAVSHPRSGAFLTAPSPGIVATSLPNQHYDSHEEYLFAVADALRAEYATLAGADLTLQVDAPDLLHTFHRTLYDGRDVSVDSPEAYATDVLPSHVEAINTALADVPASQVRLHTCWGNYDGPHHLDVPLESVLPVLYDLDVSGLSVELCGARHDHEHEAFAEHPLPDDWDLLPGVVDVKTNAIEHPETVARRLERVASVVAPSRIVAAPNCGFGTLAYSAAHRDLAWAKLEALVAGADRAATRLG